jgi:hypothetical protein
MPAFGTSQPVANIKLDNNANSAFFTVQPGEYTAIVRKIVDKDPYMAALSNYPHPTNPEGKWSWIKIVPEFELVNEAHTQINKQDMTIGIFDNGQFVSPNPKNSPIFQGWYKGKLGAGTLLRALGLLVKGEGDSALLRGDTAQIVDAVVKVKTAVGLYSKSNENLGPDETLALLKEANGGEVPTFAQYRPLLVAYNEANGRTGDRELKMKNYVVDVWALTADEARAKGYHIDANGTVFLTKATAAAASPANSAANW